jgi:2-succinyl-5-enolpyruvyl-6-hydroxy-3-cyclohexene-1-carboxylate synthase
MSVRFASVQTAWSRLLVTSLRDAGVRDLVISPGSRSTPLTAAALDCAGLRCHAVIDERSAAFFALGQARASGRPSALLCTSGTAAAQYLPALIEAGHSHVSLVVVTADRPPELRGCDAPQAIDQIKLYGAVVRHFAELGVPEADAAALRGLRRQVLQAVARSQYPDPGPVHMNAALRKPLEPVAPATPEELALAAAADQLTTGHAVFTPPRPAEPDPGAVAELAARCAARERGLIVAGPAALAQREARDAVLQLAACTGYPLLAEAASQLRFLGARSSPLLCDGFDLLLAAGSFTAAAQPELIIQLGAPPTSTALSSYLGAPAAHRTIVAPWSWSDPHGSAAQLWPCAVKPAIELLLAALDRTGPRRGTTAWASRFAAGNALVWQEVERALGQEIGAAVMNEASATRAALAACPAAAILALGNSLAIRDVDRYVPAATEVAGVWSQRGANGIDGLVSGAAGAASATGRPVLLLLGDVSFLHDLGGLAVARNVDTPLVITVIDNGGGRIFEQLPAAAAPALAPSFERFWLTPPRVDLAHAAATFGLPYSEAAEPVALQRAVSEAAARPGASLVRAIVRPDSARLLHGSLRQRIEERCAAGLP